MKHKKNFGKKRGQGSSHGSRHDKKRHSRSVAKREVEGVYAGTRHGYGFVAVEGFEEDVFIPFRDVGDALSGDRVRVRLGQRGAGEISAVLERKHEEVVGVLRKDDHGDFFLEPRIPGFPSVDLVEGDDKRDKKSDRFEEGLLVLVRITQFPNPRRPHPMGRVVKIFGKSGDPVPEEKATMARFHLREHFSKTAEEEAASFGTRLDPKQFSDRVDLTDRIFFTIDGKKARDFDDAVSLDEIPGGFRLWVAIADVAHYVKRGTALDQEAYQRATSVYFPTRAVHMLPHALSTGLCSLLPNENRLAMVAELTFDRDGTRKSMKFMEGIFRSRARLTYEEVEEVLKGKHLPESRRLLVPLASENERPAIEKMLGLMGVLQDGLSGKRRERGSLDFDLPEAEFVFADDEGERAIEAIIKGTRLRAHRMIEEFMVAANEAVSEYLTERRVPIPYRIHELPDPVKLQDFFRVLQKIPSVRDVVDLPAGGKSKKSGGGNWQKPGFIAKLLEELKDTPQAHLLHHLLLTSLRLAVYSADNKGHFGLASSFYSHFTSPIRRYPDLILHRALKASIRREKLPYSVDDLKVDTLHCTKSEQNAVAAERDMVAFYKILFMSRHLGKVFPGRIEKIMESGFFVELEPFFVDGFVPIESLGDDSFRYHKEKQQLVGRSHTFKQSDLLDVQVAACDLDRRRMTLVPPSQT